MGGDGGNLVGVVPSFDADDLASSLHVCSLESAEGQTSKLAPTPLFAKSFRAEEANAQAKDGLMESGGVVCEDELANGKTLDEPWGSVHLRAPGCCEGFLDRTVTLWIVSHQLVSAGWEVSSTRLTGVVPTRPREDGSVVVDDGGVLKVEGWELKPLIRTASVVKLAAEYGKRETVKRWTSQPLGF